MILKVTLLACIAAVNAGLLSPYAYNPYNAYPAQPAIASSQSNILRSPYNLGQISTYSKAIDTPFSSVRKSDIRVSNPGVATYGGLGLSSPLVSTVGVGAPIASPLVSHVGVGPFASPLVSRVGVGAVTSPLVSHVGVAAPYAKVATTGGLLGVAYSAAPAVSHMSYSNGLGLTYAW